MDEPTSAPPLIRTYRGGIDQILEAYAEEATRLRAEGWRVAATTMAPEPGGCLWWGIFPSPRMLVVTYERNA